VSAILLNFLSLSIFANDNLMSPVSRGHNI
jgi:hypothetical protein